MCAMDHWMQQIFFLTGIMLVIRDANKGHWLRSRPHEEGLKRDGNSAGHQGATKGCLKKLRCRRNSTPRIKQQKVMEVNGDQQKATVVAVRRATPK